MGMQEYLVTRKQHTLDDFIAVFNTDVSCITTALQNINGIDSAISKIDVGTELVVLFGDRHELRYKLIEKFPEEHFWYSESVNLAATGTYFPSKEQLSVFFKDQVIEHI